MAVLSHCHTLRTNGWIGNFAALIESESFAKERLGAKSQDRYGRGRHAIRGRRVEAFIERTAEQLLPLLGRCNWMMLRNPEALKSRREPANPSVSIGSAGQGNLAAEQVNTATAPVAGAEQGGEPA